MTADAGEDVEKEEHSSTAGTTTLEISLAVPQKTGHDTSGGPCYNSSGNSWAYSQRIHWHAITAHALLCLIYNSQKLESIQMSLNGEMDTENVLYLHNGILFSN